MASAALASSVPQAVKNAFTTTARRTGNTATGVVVSAGLAEKTAKVRIGGEIWNNKVKKVQTAFIPPTSSFFIFWFFPSFYAVYILPARSTSFFFCLSD